MKLFKVIATLSEKPRSKQYVVLAEAPSAEEAQAKMRYAPNTKNIVFPMAHTP